jgi:hypothetical protein
MPVASMTVGDRSAMLQVFVVILAFFFLSFRKRKVLVLMGFLYCSTFFFLCHTFARGPLYMQRRSSDASRILFFRKKANASFECRAQYRAMEEKAIYRA